MFMNYDTASSYVTLDDHHFSKSNTVTNFQEVICDNVCPYCRML